MRNINSIFAAIGGSLVLFLLAAPAQAQATRTWVSGVGDDANPCSRTAPCKTFAGAISKTAVGGEINCLDSGGFGSVTITKSITIKCEGTIGGVLAAGTFGININDSGSGTPGTAIVTISGLDIEGAGTGTNGIQFVSGGVLHVHKTQIRNFRQSGAGGNGIAIIHSSGGGKKIFVADSYITDNGATNANAGILVRPTGGAGANVSINNTQIESNGNGVFMDGGGGGGVNHVHVRNSVLSGSSNSGIAVNGNGSVGAFTAVVADSMMSFNGNTGAAVAGTNATMKVGGNTIANNVTGVSGGAQMQSFKDNRIADNGSDGTPITAVNSGGFTLN
jgi:hypothetical protein